MYQVIIYDGDKRLCIQCNADQTILEAAEEANIELNYSCGVGVCSDCAVELLGGKVCLQDGHVAGDECLKKGLVLLCVSSPLSNLTLRIDSNNEIDNIYSSRIQ